MTDEPPLTILPDTKGWERIVANQRQALYEKEQELDRLRAENFRLSIVAEDFNALMELREKWKAGIAVIEAARAWVKTPIEAPPHGLYLHPLERDLSSAVAAYEAQQGEKL